MIQIIWVCHINLLNISHVAITKFKTLYIVATNIKCIFSIVYVTIALICL